MNQKIAVTVLLIIIFVIAFLAHVTTTPLEFSRYNRAWTGTSDLFADLDYHGAYDLISYEDLTIRNDTLILIIAPGKSFSESDAAAFQDFLEDGNTLFIADETGTSNSLLSEIGGSIQIQPANISSVAREFSESWWVIAYARSPDPLLVNVSKLTLNKPSAVHGGEILVSTNLFSWDDSNMNYHIDVNEKFSVYGILARERVGNGTLYVFSDPSIFINGMRRARLSSDNEVFIQNLLSLHQNILVEQPHSLTGGGKPVYVPAFRATNVRRQAGNHSEKEPQNPERIINLGFFSHQFTITTPINLSGHNPQGI